MAYVIGLDIGTTSTIGILLDVDTGRRALATRPVTLHHTHPGWAEEDPTQWWANVCAIVPELLAQGAVAASEVRAVGVAGMLPAIVLLDGDDQLLRLSIQQSDGRCGEQVQQLKTEVDESAFVRKAGNGVNQQLAAAKLRWLEQHEPHIFGRIATVMGSYDYINWRLTGARCIEHNWALEAGFVDLATHQVSDDLIRLAHLRPEQLPPKLASHAIVGQITPEAARQTGLPAGIPVVGGVADLVASAYAAGLSRPGDTLIKLGGSGDILMASPEARPDARMFLDYHAIPGLYLPNGCMACSGSLLNWFAAHFGAGADQHGQSSRHASLDLLAQATPAGADGVLALPYFLGEKTPIHDPWARGTFTGLSLNHGLGHVWRALLEGVAFGMRHHADVFTDMGMRPQRLLASDGGANSRIWLQIIADVMQMPITPLHGHPGSCLGAAWVAAMGTGLSADWHGVANCVVQAEPIEPQRALGARYDQAYHDYRALYQSLKPFFHRNRPA